MKFLLKYLKPFFGIMTVGIIIKVIGTVVELFIPLILTHILDNVVITERISEIIFWGVMMLLCAAAACVFNIWANRMAAKVSRRFSERVRNDLFSRTMRLSSAQVDAFTIPSLESRITTDTYNVHNFVGMMQRMGIRAPIMLVGGVSITLFMDPLLSIAMIATLPFIFITVYFISRKGVPLYTKVQKATDKMTRVVREDTQGIRVIKALSKVEYEHRRYEKVNRELSESEQHAGFIMSGVHPVMTLFMNTGLVLVVALAANLVAGNRSTPSTVIAFMQYFTQISMAMMSVTRIFTMYTKCSASAKRISEVINAPEDITIKSETDFPRSESGAHIEFKNVSFSYKGKQNDLENINFSLSRGESLGIIGATGSGKSTLIRLLMRLYDVGDGAVYICGRDVRTIPAEELYPMFGAAFQHDFLYAETIEENIDLGRHLSHEQIEFAAKIAQAHDFISAFPDGYEHQLSQKGTNISGGQKQRLLISRAIASHPEILVLDDSSSALDYKTDANLRAALRENMSGTTLVTVAQRVSSVKDCTLILVLDEGKIIGKGTHEQLLSSCPEYREISESQMGGAFVE
jgi:ATP-binding cassette subfamily B protein